MLAILKLLAENVSKVKKTIINEIMGVIFHF
jgi:hypothetical protein